MLAVAYRDELGYVLEETEDETIEFLEGKAYVNDKQIPVENIVRIGITERSMA